MTQVAGKNRVNRPYFFRTTDGDRMEVPARGTGQGDLEGAALQEFLMYQRVGQIEAASVQFAPVNSRIPEIGDGAVQIGVGLTSSQGDWSGEPAPSFARSWQRGDTADGPFTAIAGATDVSYTPVAADLGKFLRFSVTATNDLGSTTATSDPTAAVIAAFAPPLVTTEPTISGNPTVGQVLTSTNGAFSGNPAPTVTRVWRVDGQDVAGETGTTYTIKPGDLGKMILMRATAQNTQGAISADTQELGPVIAAPVSPANTAAPIVTGDAVVGSTLTSTNGTWTGTPTPTYSRVWERSANGTTGWSAIDGSTATTYVLAAADEGQHVRCAVSASNTGGNVAANSNAIGPVAAAEE